MKTKYFKIVEIKRDAKKIAILDYSLVYSNNVIQQQIEVIRDSTILKLASTIKCNEFERDINLFMERGFVYSKSAKMYLAEILGAKNGSLEKAYKVISQKFNFDITNIIIEELKEGIREWNELETLIKIAENEFKDV